MHLGMAVTEAIVAVITAALSEMSCIACRGVYETCEGKDSRHLGSSVTGLVAMQYQGIVEKDGVHFLADWPSNKLLLCLSRLRRAKKTLA